MLRGLTRRHWRHGSFEASMIVGMRNVPPSCVRAMTKSSAQTWFGQLGRRRIRDPSLSHGRPLLGCLRLQPLPSPDAFGPLVVHAPALSAEQRRDPAIAVAAILAGQQRDRLGERRLIVGPDTSIALRRARLSDDPAHPTLGQPISCAGVLNTAPATLGA